MPDPSPPEAPARPAARSRPQAVSADLARRVALVLGALLAPAAAHSLDEAFHDAVDGAKETGDETGAETGDETGTETGDASEAAGEPAVLRQVCVAGVQADGACPPLADVAEAVEDVVDRERSVAHPAAGGRFCDVDWEKTPAAEGTPVDDLCCYLVDVDCRDVVGCGCAHGRPLLVRGVPRIAAPRRGEGWFDPRMYPPALAGLTLAERAEVGWFWASVGTREHASVASFQRAGAELIALGAPADLVARTLRAGLDEVRHARGAFTLASRFLGVRVAPGGSPAGGERVSEGASGDLLAFVVRQAREACVEETRSLAAAGAMAEAARDPAVARFLRGLVRDEARHVALAWDTLLWAVRCDRDLGERARQIALAALKRPISADPPGPRRAPRLEAWGVLSDERLAAAAAGLPWSLAA